MHGYGLICAICYRTVNQDEPLFSPATALKGAAVCPQCAKKAGYTMCTKEMSWTVPDKRRCKGCAKMCDPLVFVNVYEKSFVPSKITMCGKSWTFSYALYCSLRRYRDIWDRYHYRELIRLLIGGRGYFELSFSNHDFKRREVLFRPYADKLIEALGPSEWLKEWNNG